MSNKAQLDKPAPDFALSDLGGNIIRLSDFRHKKHLLLVFNRGFQ
jgi:peroxiredoxin